MGNFLFKKYLRRNSDLFVISEFYNTHTTSIGIFLSEAGGVKRRIL